MSATRATLIRAAAERLAEAGVTDAARDARLLMRWAGRHDGAALAAVIEDTAPLDEAARFEAAADRRAGREPLSHITGERLFWDRAFLVTPDVLDPRPETEVLIAEALRRGAFERVLDIGTGSGCILLTLLAEWPGATGLGTDISPAALEIAKANAAALDLAGRVEFLQTNWADAAAGPFDLIVSNPPYIAANEMAALSPEVRLHEPHGALTPGGDGLDAYRAIAPALHPRLAPGGFVMVEIGPTQYEAVAALLATSGLNVLMVIPDLDQRARVIIAQA
jgi:release factor glutamine methyltransferase